ncbi:MAG: FHA domain-containing protein [Actinobacteria bacterium]|nr:FHA domain-containing protein [Actinomycetota bacterium]
MTDQLLGLLRFVLLAALYLFFARVVWAVWTEVRVPAVSRSTGPVPLMPADGTTKVPRRQRVTELRVVAPKRHKGQQIEIGSDPLVIGRSENTDLSVADDSFLSNVHARIWIANGAAVVEDLGSTNGTLVNGNRISDVVALRPGDRVQMGSLIVEAER